ncbi:MAG TPA: 50S ribosomal protein L10 [Verrucomicrobiota bacterium]|nr:50S ribosomal protein L10 [Verrucomicrobiota bacterium]HNU50243.1 50S ribosomal protein L10 [Verrucomicrobiota bacterium]
MRAEKKSLTRDYVARLNASPFFLVVDYQGLNVVQFTELRKRLLQSGAEVHVVKNSLFRRAVKDAGLADLGGGLAGQLAAVTGQRDVSVAAKVLKKFAAECGKPKLQFGYLGSQRLEKEQLLVLADLPSLEVLRGQLLGVLQGPAAALVRLLQTPAAQLARVLQARVDSAGAQPAV